MKHLIAAAIIIILWTFISCQKKNPATPSTPAPKTDSSKLTDNQTVYTTGDIGQLVALDANTGAVKWSFTLDKNANINTTKITSSPTLNNGVLYIGSSDHNVYAIDAATGIKKWSFLTQTYSIIISVYESSPIVANGTVYIGGDKLYAINAATGVLQWSYQAPREFITSPCYYNGYVYANAMDGNSYKINSSDGTLSAINDWGSSQANFSTTSPRYHNGRIFNLGGPTPNSTYKGSSNIYSYDANSTGPSPWGQLLPDPYATEASTPVFSNDSLYVALDSTIYAFDADMIASTVYKPKWTCNVGSHFLQSIPVADSTQVFAGCQNGVLYALNASNGTKNWSFTTRVNGDEQIISSPTLANGVLFFASNYAIYAVWANTGKEFWHKNTTGNYFSQSSACIVSKNGTIFHSNANAINN